MNFSEIPLFDHITDQDCRRMMSCFQTSFVSLNGEQELDIRKYYHHDIGIVLSGSVEISRIDFNGRKSILEIIEKNEMFGRLYSYTPEENDTITAKCLKPAKIAFIPNEHIQSQCENACSCHTALISNLQRTIREKLVNYFYQLSAVIGTNDFQLPYSMTTLADYLCVDRSAMTRELKHMKKDGLIEGDGKNIRLLI